MKAKFKIPNFFKRAGISIAVGLAIVISTSPATSTVASASAINSEMNKMFNSMINVTNPGAYKTSRRGVISGGSLQVRNKIMNINLVSAQPPSFAAGCGGIDFFGGSFSFINAEQFVQLGRTIASNAQGYAFHLALEAMAPAVRQIIQTLQDVVDMMNKHLGDSCQLAKGLVNDVASAFDGKERQEASLKKSLKDGFDTIFQSMKTNMEGNTENMTPDTKEEFVGNITWKAMKESSVSSWSTFGGTDLMEIMMTLTGAIILMEDEPDEDNISKSQPKIIVQGYGGELTLTDFMYGTNDARKLKCSDVVLCESVSLVKVDDIKGFHELIDEELNDIILKIRTGQDLSQNEQQFLGAMPHGVGGMIFRLSRYNMAEVFKAEAIKPLALSMGYELIRQMQTAVVRSLIKQQDSGWHPEAMRVAMDSMSAVDREYQALSAQVGGIGEVFNKYNALMLAIDKTPTMMPDQDAPNARNNQ